MSKDFIGLIGDLTNFIQNERTRAYNEGVDMMLNSAKQWMMQRNYRADADNIPDLLDHLMRQVEPYEDDAITQDKRGNET